MYKFYKKIRLKIIPHRHYISGAEKFSLCEKTGCISRGYGDCISREKIFFKFFIFVGLNFTTLRDYISEE